MERTRVMLSRIKKARLLRRAAAGGILALLLGGFVFFVTRPASTEATTGKASVAQYSTASGNRSESR